MAASHSPSSHPAVQNQAWVTLATNDSYALGALVLGNSLRRAGTLRKKVIMITRTVSQAMQEQLRRVFDEIVDVAELDSGDFANLELLERPELGITFTKLHCWKLTHYAKCVFLDADTLVLRNCDELFDRDEFSAAPDAGWPDCFNSGVFVFHPSNDTFKALMEHAQTQGSFDGGDQGLLNTFFSDWPTKDIGKHLSFLYNMCATATYTYLPAYRYYGQNVRIIHFIGASKPWHVQFDPKGQPQPRTGEEHTLEHLKQWWQIFNTDVFPNLDSRLQEIVPPASSPAGASGRAVRHPGGPMGESCGPSAGQPGAEDPHDKRESWEEGRPDYMGSASFDNILKKISSTMSTPDISPHSSHADLRRASLPNLDQADHYWSDLSHPSFGEQESWNNNIIEHRRLTQSQSLQDVRDYRPFEAEPLPDQTQLNKSDWERGYPDYLGRNAFDNIKAKLDAIVPDRSCHHATTTTTAETGDAGYSTGGRASNEESPDREGHLFQNDGGGQGQEEQDDDPPPPLPEDNRHDWEIGHPDYRGAASFDNILRRLEENLGPIERPQVSKFKTGLPVKGKRTDEDVEEAANGTSFSGRSSSMPGSTTAASSTTGTYTAPLRRVLVGQNTWVGMTVERISRSVDEATCCHV